MKQIVSGSLTLEQTGLPGIALAQRTTVTSCLSPSSFRLVSKDTELSGCAGSCPALTTAGSMDCKRLSKDKQERRVGGMPIDEAWDAPKAREILQLHTCAKNTNACDSTVYEVCS